MASYRKYLLEIEAALRAVAPVISKHKPEAYIGGGKSSYQYLGHRVPQIRSVLQKMQFTFQKDLSLSEVHKLWTYVWNNTNVYEVACLPLMYFADSMKTGERLAPLRRDVVQCVERIDNWAHSDTLSSIYARILEEDRKGMLPVLEKWGNSSNPWKRRQSIVSLLYYASARKKFLPFPKLISMVKIQINDEDYYVQKGVGWTLREIGNVYPDETYSFLEKRITSLSAYAFSAATEKLSKTKKTKLKKLRAVSRGI